MAKIYLYSCLGDNRNINKSLTFYSDFDVSITEDCSVENPRFLILNDKIFDFLSCNYCYIDIFKRYYFLNLKVTKNKMVIAECNVDAIYSFRDYIKSLKCLISRNEFVYNDMIPDKQIIARSGTKTDKKKVGSLPTNITYVLTVTGGVDL